MSSLARVAQMLVRVVGLVMLVLGILLWTGGGPGLLAVHIALGFIFVLALWALAAAGARAGIGTGLVAITVAWSVLMPVFGLAQAQLARGGAHWIIQVLHLLVGLVAIGLGEMIGGRVRRAGAGAAAG